MKYQFDTTSIIGAALVFLPLWITVGFIAAVAITLGIAVLIGNAIIRGQSGS